jgi:glutathione synthase/RimK-type ligase-like ATP-grasp enzyme
MKNIFILTGYNHFFGQARKPWVSINTKLLIDELMEKGLYVKEYPFHRIVNSEIEIRDSIVFYTFSQRANLNSYIRDAINYLSKNGNILIPNLDLLYCYENKGYQESIKKNLGIENLQALSFSSKRELAEYNIDFPVVLKPIEGSCGKNIFLVNDNEKLIKCISKIEPRMSILEKADLFRRKYFRLNKKFLGFDDFNYKKDYLQYKDYISHETRFILQEFVPGLQFDYKIVIMGEKYYVTKRLNRKRDFRASGGGRFTYDFKATDELLNYAKHIFECFDTPCLSIDVGFGDNKFYLFEFQASHFGIVTMARNKGYYKMIHNNWEFVPNKIIFEKELASSLILYLHKKDLI